MRLIKCVFRYKTCRCSCQAIMPLISSWLHRDRPTGPFVQSAIFFNHSLKILKGQIQFWSKFLVLFHNVKVFVLICRQKLLNYQSLLISYQLILSICILETILKAKSIYCNFKLVCFVEKVELYRLLVRHHAKSLM